MANREPQRIGSPEVARSPLPVATAPPDAVKITSLEYFWACLAAERKNQRLELRARIFELWDAAVDLAAAQPPVTSVATYMSLQRKIAAFDPYAPKSLGALVLRLLGAPQVELLKRLGNLRGTAEAEKKHIDSEIQVRGRLLEALTAAESAGICPMGPLAALVERVKQGIRLREARKSLLENLDSYDLVDRVQKYKVSLIRTMTQMSSLHEIFEGVSEALTGPHSLSTKDIERVHREHERFLAQFAGMADGATKPQSLRQMLENAVNAEKVLQQLPQGPRTEPFSDALRIFRESSLQEAVQSDPVEFRTALASLGGRIAPLLWHPAVQQALPSGIETPKRSRDKRAGPAHSKVPEVSSRSDGANALTQVLVGEMGLPLRSVREICANVDPLTVERRLGWLKSALPNAATAILKHDLSVL